MGHAAEAGPWRTPWKLTSFANFAMSAFPAFSGPRSNISREHSEYFLGYQREAYGVVAGFGLPPYGRGSPRASLGLGVDPAFRFSCRQLEALPTSSRKACSEIPLANALRKSMIFLAQGESI